MELIRTKSDLTDNVTRLRGYLRNPGADRDFAVDLIRNGICFVVTNVDGQLFFSPSRFVGYRANSRHDHTHNNDKDGRETNPAIQAVLGKSPTLNAPIEMEYERFCASLGTSVRKAPFGIARKFWDQR